MENSRLTAENNSKESDKKKSGKRAIRAPLMSAEQLHGSTRAPEHIGHVLVAANAAERRTSKPEASAGLAAKTVTGAEGLRAAAAGKRIETMNRSDLLAISDKINIEGSSLRQIYETHLIGEQGLRRLVAEYMRGGDIQGLLRREIVEHEIDFERDPVLRGLNPDGTPIDESTEAGETKLRKLLENAAKQLPTANEENAGRKASAAQAKHARVQHAKLRPLDIGLAALIAVLIIMLIVLFMMRH